MTEFEITFELHYRIMLKSRECVVGIVACIKTPEMMLYYPTVSDAVDIW